MIPPSIFTQGVNYIQRNDLAYRAIIDTLGFDAPYILTSRNKDERRENTTAALIAAVETFIVAPLFVVLSNKVLAKKDFSGNTAFFKLPWRFVDNSLDSTKVENAVNHLQDFQKDIKIRLKDPTIFEKPFIKLFNTTVKEIDAAIAKIKENPKMLDKVYNAKKGILYVDLVVTVGIISSIAPIKNWVSKKFAHKTRFTGSQNYLSDNDLEKLTQDDKKSKLQKTLFVLITLMPLTFGVAAHSLTRKHSVKGKLYDNLIKLRNSMDYDSGIYMTLMTCFLCFVAKDLNLVNFARDKYERLETAAKWSMIVPSWYWGEKLFNGPIAKIIDNISKAKYNTPEGTFYQLSNKNNIFVKTKKLKDILSKNMGNPNINGIRKLAIIAVGTSLIIHSAIVAGVISGTNQLTKLRILKDLRKIDTNKATLATSNDS